LLGCLHKFLDELASILREPKVFAAVVLLVDLADQPPKSCPSRRLAILSIEEHLVGRAQNPPRQLMALLAVAIANRLDEPIGVRDIDHKLGDLHNGTGASFVTRRATS
jgi:hypothetical protein